MSALCPDHHRAAWSLAPYFPASTVETARMRELEVTLRLAKHLWRRDQAPLVAAVQRLTRNAFLIQRTRRDGHAAHLVEAYADPAAVVDELAFERAQAHAVKALESARRGVETLPLDTFFRVVMTTPAVQKRLGTALTQGPGAPSMPPSEPPPAAARRSAAAAL
jgi:hypothetical protein